MRGSVCDKLLIETDLVLSKPIDSGRKVVNFLIESCIHRTNLGVQSRFYAVNLSVYGIDLRVQ